MPKNNRRPSTVTRSISWRFDLLAAIDTKAEALRVDRSSYINGVLEHMLGLYPRPEMVGRNIPFVDGDKGQWAALAKDLELEGNQGREIKRKHKAAVTAALKKIKPTRRGRLVKRRVRSV